MRQLNHIIFDLITAIKLLFSKNIGVIVLSIPPVSFFNVLVANIKKINIITDVEDLWPLFLVDMGLKNTLAIKYMDKCSKYIYKSSTAIAPVSQGMLDYIENMDTYHCEKWVAPLGVNLDNYNKDLNLDNLLCEKKWKDDFKIMYVGAHGRANNLYPVLDVIKEINLNNNLSITENISIIFIGDGDDKVNLIEYADSLNLESVYFEDAIPNNLVPYYLNEADICLTNLKKVESFKLVRPNKLFQYMALSKPIICGIWGEAANIVVNEAKCGIYVDFEEAKKSAIEIINFINNRDELQKIGECGRKYVEQFGNREKIFEEYYERIKKYLIK